MTAVKRVQVRTMLEQDAEPRSVKSADPERAERVTNESGLDRIMPCKSAPNYAGYAHSEMAAGD